MVSTTYDSLGNLNLSQVPLVNKSEDEDLYNELLDIHNAIEILMTHTDSNDSGLNRDVKIITEDFIITDTEGTLIAVALTEDVDLLLPSAVNITGKRYNLKCIDDTFSVTVSVQAGEELEEETTPFELFKGEYIEVVSDGANWVVA
jgi:hypothetical protein